MIERSRYKEIRCEIKETKLQSKQLKRKLASHESLIYRFDKSIVKSQKALKRLLEAECTNEEMEQSSFVEGDNDEFSIDNVSQNSTVASSEHDLKLSQKDELPEDADELRHHDSTVQTKIIAIGTMSSRPLLEQGYQRNNFQRFERSFLEPVASKRLIMAILSLSAREIFVLDSSDSTGRHRRESMWDSCIDVRILITENESPVASDRVDQAHSDSKCFEKNSTIDPSIPLCPYELMQNCMDPFCSYQHLTQRERGQILPRERIPLSKLDMPQHFVLNVADTRFDNTSSLVKETASLVGSFTNNDDFLSVPPHVSDIPCIGLSKLMHSWIQSSGLDSFWWMAQEHINLIQSTMMNGGALDLIGIMCSDFMDDSRKFIVSENTVPTTIKNGYLFVGMLIDSFRLAINAGRCDVMKALLEVFDITCMSWDNPSPSEDVKDFKSICMDIYLLLESEEQKYFPRQSSSSSCPFETTFETQLSLGLLSYMVERLYWIHLSNNSCLHTEWTRVVKVIGDFSHDNTLLGSATSDLTSVLREAFALSNLNERADVDVGLDALLQDISLGIKIRDCLASVGSCRTLIDEMLLPMQSFIARIFNDSAKNNTMLTSNIVRGTVRIAFVVLGALKSVTRRIDKDEAIEKYQIELEELYNTIDSILLSHRSFTNGIPCVDLLLNPIFAANIALACSIKRYDKAHGRLENLLLKDLKKRKVATSKLPESFMMHTSELLWSQFLQLYMSLPTEIKRKESVDMVMSSLRLPKDLVQQHEILANQVVERQIFLHHVQLQNDWNLLQNLAAPGILHSCAEICQILTEEKKMLIDLDVSGSAMNLRSSHGEPTLRHTIPHSLLLCGFSVTSLNLRGCVLRKLPHHFGFYFKHLRVSVPFRCFRVLLFLHIQLLLTFGPS
jgi:Putative zinc-finger domain